MCGRRCYHNIPATLYGKYRQAVAAKSGEWSRVERKREKLEAWKLRIKSSEHELMLWKRREEHKRGQVSLLKKKETRKNYGETVWKSRMTPSVAENWMNRGKRGSYERSKYCPLLQWECRRTSWSQCNISCKRWRKGGTISCLSTRGCKRGHKRYKASRIKGKYAERKLGGKRRNAENQRRNRVEGRALHSAG